MKRLYVTVGSRVEYEGDKPEDKGEFLAIDWETKEIVGTYIADSRKEVKVGRSRGASGMAWHDDRIYICCRGGIMFIDPDTYEEAGRVTGQVYGGLHGMRSDGTTLWVTAHGRDILVGVRDGVVTEEIHTLLPTDEERTNGINAVGFSPSGEMFIMYGHKFQIFNWTEQKGAVEDCEHAPHDITFIDDDHCLYSQSSRRSVWKANVRTGEQTCVIDRQPLYEKGGRMYKKPSRPGTKLGLTHVVTGWVRGIAYDKDTNAAFVMSAPGTIIEYDATTWEERDQFVFTKRSEANPFEIILDPRDWT